MTESCFATFLEQDRVRAGYAICDLDPAEFPRTRWGVAREGGQLISVVLEYLGLTPQPLFVMGDSAGIAQILREVIRPRLVYLAGDHSHMAEIAKLYRIDPGPPMIRMVATRATFRPHEEGVGHASPAGRDHRLEPPVRPRLHLAGYRPIRSPPASITASA